MVIESGVVSYWPRARRTCVYVERCNVLQLILGLLNTGHPFENPEMDDQIPVMSAVHDPIDQTDSSQTECQCMV